MRLEELVVEGFRKLAGRHVVRPAQSGITVVSGDNEEGKSTLLDALKRAFFMKHNTTGSDREAIQPLGAEAAPFVAVSFMLNGQSYQLEKRFRRNGVRLQGPGSTLEGDAAELALAQLMAFEWPGRGAARVEHMGLAGLLWVDQGTTFAAEQGPSATAMLQLEPALADQMAVLGRGEQAPRLMTEIRRQRDRFWTGARGQAKGELLELEQAMTSLRAELAELEKGEAAIEQLLERLAQNVEKRRNWLAADHLGRAGREVERTRSALAQVRALEEEARLKAAEQKAALSEHARLTEKAKVRQQLVDQIDAMGAEIIKLEQEALEAAPALDRARRERAAADATEAEGRAALVGLEAALQAQVRQAERWRLERQLALLERSFDAARTAARSAGELEARVAAEPLTPAAMAELEVEETRLGEARAALRAVATRLVLMPNERATAVTLDGTAIDPAGTLELTASAVLELSGFGRIEVTPGGERLASLRQELQDGEAALEERLKEIAVVDLREARRRVMAKDRHANEAAAARQRLADILAANDKPDLAALEAAILRCRARLADLEDVPTPVTVDEAALDLARETAERKLAAAREQVSRLAENRIAAAAREAELAKALDHNAFAQARFAQEQARFADQLAIERDALADDELQRQLSTSEAMNDAAIAAAARIDRELARATPDRARREAEQAERRRGQLEEEGKNQEREADRLKAELKGAGGQGIGDRKAEVLGRLELAQRRHGSLLAEAKAWRLLSQTIDEVDRARQDALVAPLAARVEPYLRELMGEAALDFQPHSLQLASLRRGAAAEPFKSLSIGTREQLAVIARLAIGEILAERHGECPPLILDDALVYADALRLARMKSILEAAGERQQIIILTCRKEDYLGLDARYLTIEECREERATA